MKNKKIRVIQYGKDVKLCKIKEVATTFNVPVAKIHKLCIEHMIPHLDYMGEGKQKDIRISDGDYDYIRQVLDGTAGEYKAEPPQILIGEE